MKEYASQIPHFCKYRTMEQHIHMMLCWSMVKGYVQRGANRGVEGPNYCQSCPLSIKARRLAEKGAT